MSSIAMKKANWADVESSDDEVEPENEKKASNNDDDEEEEEENEEHDEDARTTSVAANAQVKEKEIQVLQLSKKERKELRERELSDLDSLLAEFSRAPDEQIEPQMVNSTLVEQENEQQEDPCDEKKKKKKKPASRRGQNCENVANENGETILHEDSPRSTIPVADLATVLKAKVVKSKKSSATDIKKLAVAEALKVSNSTDTKKKKKDKKGYNETSY